MNILYSIGDYYSDITGVSLVSLLENNRDCPQINLFILDFGISEPNKERLLAIAHKYGRDICFVETSKIASLLPEDIHTAHLSIAAYGRIFAGSLLPESLDRVIYLDGDTMIRQSLLPLWGEDLSGWVAGGLMELHGVWLRKTLFLPPEATYANSGVLVIDLKRWRELDVESKSIKYICTFNGYLVFRDQDVVNAVLSKVIKVINPKYNFLITRRAYSFEECFMINKTIRYYSEREYNEAQKDPVIAHFCGSGFSDPHVKEAYPEFVNEYMRYREMTPWKEMPLKTLPEYNSALKRQFKKLFYMLPNSLNARCKHYFLVYRYKKTYKKINRLFKVSSIEVEDFRVPPISDN